MPKIYLSPSTQEFNLYQNTGSEEYWMNQIADAMERYLHPKGVMVLIEAEHMCMTMRGVQKPGTKTVTTMVRGAFERDYSLQQTFLQMVK